MMWVQIAADYPVHFIDEVSACRRGHPGSVTSRSGELHFQDFLRHLEIMKESIPALNAKPHLVRELGLRVCLKDGWSDLQELQLARARPKLRLALGFRLYSLKAWVL